MRRIVAVPLGDLTDIVMGQAPPGEECNKEGAGTAFVKAGEFGERCPIVREWTTKPLRLARKGDVLVCVVGATAGKINEAIDCAIGRSVAAVRPKDHKKLVAPYLYHFLGTTVERLRIISQGVAQGVITREMIEALKIPLPSLSDQRRIADILDKAYALRAKRRAALAQLDALAQSIFLDMFGDPTVNSNRWKNDTALGDVAEIVSGITKGRKLKGQSTRTIAYLSVLNVQDRALDLSFVKNIEATQDEIDRYQLQKGDLLLTEGGDPDKLGRGTLWNCEIQECIHQNHIFRVRLKTDRIAPLFLNWIVGSERGKRYFLRSAKQTTGIASINMSQLRAFPLLIPPLDIQREFERRIAHLDRVQAFQQSSMTVLNGLFASLQHRAFRGELTPGEASKAA
jgi:type I restriction enzyme, S subunit